MVILFSKNASHFATDATVQGPISDSTDVHALRRE
jgi:hypothetical protein